jgi:cyanophycinase-like exopeptidase
MKIFIHLNSAFSNPPALAVWLVLNLGVLPLAHGQLSAPVANFILGGGDRHCSSFAGEAAGRGCTQDWKTILAEDPTFAGLQMDDINFTSTYPAPPFTYSLTATHIERLRHSPDALIDAHRKTRLLARLSARLLTGPPSIHLTFEALDQGLSEDLSAPERTVLRNALVDPVAPWKRKRELRSVAYASNPYVKANLLAFVQAARDLNGGQTPTIGVVTASAGSHPFAEHDVNAFALMTAGAQVVYLPLDSGMRQALDHNDCEHLPFYYDSAANTDATQQNFHGYLVYPDLGQLQQAMCANHGEALNALLKTINGIYFSGGDQGLHLASFVSKDRAGNYARISPQLTILQNRFAAGKLVVAGTSAGNNIQGGGLWRGKPVPMLGGGESYTALRNGFLERRGTDAGTPPPIGGSSGGEDGVFPPSKFAQGGFGFFHFGVLDTHFSRRVREARLTRLTLESGMDYGFGVDENTALLVSRPDSAGTTHLSVNGSGGVFIVDVRHARGNGASNGPISIEGARLHYLNTGDVARIDPAGRLWITLDPGKPLLPARADAALVKQEGVLDYGSYNFLKLTQAMGITGAPIGWGTTERSKDRRSKQDNPFFSATLRRTTSTVFRGLQDPNNPAETRISYTDVLLKWAPCADACVPPL